MLGTTQDFRSGFHAVLEAGMIVTYSRPFRGGFSGPITRSPDLGKELQEFHDEILRRRNKFYAHTDQTDIRKIVNLRDQATLAAFLRNVDEAPMQEVWGSLTEDGVESLGVLAQVHYSQCLDELNRFRKRHGSDRAH